QKMLDQNSCLDLDIHNRLKTNYAQQIRFDQLLESALLQDVALHTEIGGALALKGPDGQQLMLTAVPFKHFSPTPQLDEARHRIALLITDKNQHYSLSKAYLQQCYRLSNREFELCELLLNAYKLEEIAEHCGITLSSV